ncbi:ROK family protein [Sphingobacterium sp. SGR-19]|uniref:ROK family protein n=1 Tax=Sphingobacterium sp. SGR-19 TaxID=2710886 RepID=UPI0013EB3523|nr:ROK family protein [Sphingobacterium sp. SGR-19]NGM65768.1 ROK family protein [Sphingobacterium sp. SGR-19]
MMNSSIEESVLCADIGGSHITAAVIDVTRQTMISNTIVRHKIDAHAAAKVILAEWARALKAAQACWGKKCDHLAISMPGPFDYDKGISLIKGLDKYDALFGMDIKREFATELMLPTESIWFMNDAEAFLRGEASQDSNKHYKSVLGLTLGTGLGAAFFQEGTVTDLNLGSSSFLNGIAEDYISSRGILAYYRMLGGIKATDVKTLVNGISTDMKAIQAIQQLAKWLADFLSQHVPVWNPDLIIIGGNISKAHALFLPTVSDILEGRGIHVPIKVATMGEHAAMLGASSLVKIKK